MDIKTATSATAYIQDEISSARLAVDELKNGISRALSIIHASTKRDHIYGVAGDIIVSIPTVLLKLEKSLNTAALCISKLDYEELRQVIRPDKVDELERILDDVRLKLPRRTGK